MAKLYDLADKYLKLNQYIEDALDSDDLTDDDIQMFIDTIEGVEDELSGKVENIAKLLKNIDGDILSYKAEEARLTKKRKYLENKVDGLKSFTQTMLEFAKVEKLKAGMFSVRLQANNPSVLIEDETLIPAAYKVAQPDTINKKDILTDLKLGTAIAGCRIADEKKHIRFA